MYFLKAKYGILDVLSFCESIPEPVFSVSEGIYEKPFELEIHASDGYRIIYTTDGSIPTVRSHRYKRPIRIYPKINLNRKILLIPTTPLWKLPSGKQNHSVTIRARCYKNGTGYGKVKNVIYSNPDIRQHQGFQVVHILMEADSLFSPKRGIYVLGQKHYSKKNRTNYSLNDTRWMKDFHPANYYERGRNWERSAEFILMNLDGETLFEQSIKLRIHGGWTRLMPVKSLRITADSIRGDDMLHYRFFEDLPYHSFKNIILRNGGNDLRYTMFRDAMIHQMVKRLNMDIQMNMDIQDYAPTVVYINGNYWGIHHIRERMDENYLAVKYNSHLENINILEVLLDTKWKSHLKLRFGDEKALQSFKQLVNYIRENSLANDEAYHAVCAQIDVDNFIDYVILETFFANCDWPHNNVRPYQFNQQSESMKQQGIDAGKWRWLFCDLDDGMCYYYSSSINMFETLLNRFTEESVTQTFLGFMENEEFKKKFITRYEYLVKNHLTTELMIEYINSFEARYKNEMERHIARWGRPWNIQFWQMEVERLRDFAKERPKIVLEQLKAL